VVAAGAAVRVGDARRAAELAGDDQEHAAIKAAGIEVLDQGGDGPVVHREAEQAVVEDVAIDGVRIPIVRRVGRKRLAGERRVFHHHRYETRARFDEPPREQGTLAVTVHAVAFAHVARFQRQIERAASLIGRQHVESAAAIGVHRTHRAGVIVGIVSTVKPLD
jgi:hypothetical protein